MTGSLIFQDGTAITGKSFGKPVSVAGEIVFATGMVGYPESLTDPSYAGQVLVLTYPLAGNYGVPHEKYWESPRIQVAGLVVSNYIDTPSHHQSQMTLGLWLKGEGVPALEIKDTRFLAQKIRNHGAPLGKIVFSGSDLPFHDPNSRNLVAEVSISRAKKQGKGKKTMVLVDCGAKRNITRSLLSRGARVITVPWNYDIFGKRLRFDGLLISNGPGDPKMASKTIETVKAALAKNIPILGICLGNQLLALAAGGDTRKLKFGHRGQNQPCLLAGTNRMYLTTQNHGFVVSKIPKGFKPWFVNANDQTNEGIIHARKPVMSVQFHPEASPGPMDTAWIFDYFLRRVNKKS